MPTDFPMDADDIETLPLTATHWGLYRALVENGRLKRLYPWSGDLAPDLAARHAEAIASLPYENRILEAWSGLARRARTRALCRRLLG